MEHVFSKEFELRYYEMDKHGLASPTALLALLEEAAADHCHAIGHGVYDLERRNIGWVLVSGTINMRGYPKYKEIVTIRTWLSKISSVRGYRENLILDAAGRVVGSAKGVWVFYDIQNRKPVPVYEDIKTKWGVNPEISAKIDAALINPVTTGAPVTEFDVYKADLDSNKHVNNIRYFHWLIESLPDETADECLLETVTAKFHSEAKYGEKIRVYVDGGPGDGTFTHVMKSSIDDRLLAAAHTKWRGIK
jgi:acyl-CoA thioesterase FadM